jgi:hypothetical protein
VQIIQKFRDQLPRLVTEELEQIIEAIRAYFLVEHKEDGTHGDIHADSITIGGIPLTPGGGSGTPAGPPSSVQYNDGGTFGGDAAFTFDETTKAVAFQGQYHSEANQVGTSGAAKTINFNDGNEHSITLTAHCTFTFTNPRNGGRYTLMLTQGGAGGWAVTWPSNVRWNKGIPPGLSGVGRTDLIVFMYLATENRYVGAYNLDYSLA